MSDQPPAEGKFEPRASVSRLVRRLMALSVEHPDVEFRCTIATGTFELGIPKGDAGDVIEQILESEGFQNGAYELKPKATLWIKLDDGRVARSVAPLARNVEGKYESVCSIIYTIDGLPSELVLAGEGHTVPVAEWEPMEDM